MPAMKNNSNNEVILRRAYAQAFGQISKEDLPKIMRGFFFNALGVSARTLIN
jgi:hypothetical protein